MRVLIDWVVVCCVAGLVAGCGSKQIREEGGSSGEGESVEVKELALGAYDASARRAGGSLAGNIFDPLDLPPASEARLASGAPGPAYWQQRVDYDINCVLDVHRGRLGVSMRVDYHNNSPHELDYIWLGLEQNLFRTESVGALSRSPRGVMKLADEPFEGGFEIAFVRASGVDLEYAVHDTLARVELERAIRPGEVFSFEMEYGFDMPPYLRRMGAEEVEQGRIFEYAQWVPQVCTYDDVNGWNTLPYLGSGEFYTNFGSWRVNITVPAGYIVSATGELTNPQDVLTPELHGRLREALASDEPVVVIGAGEVGSESIRPTSEGMLTWRFVAGDVRTFAWAASDAFQWDACGADVTDKSGLSRRVLCQSFYPREAEAWGIDAEGGGSTRAVKHSVEFYSEFLYPYPYPVMSNINGPEGGMEYPMIVFCGGRTSPKGMFGVTDHEIGHNWFPMLVNTDERRYMWFDEGFNTFINIYSKSAWYEKEPDIGRHLRQTMEVTGVERAQPVNTPPDRQWQRWVGSLNYRKTALALYLLREEVLGAERFDRAFRTYVDRWAFKSPRPADFFRCMEDAAGMDLAWFWRGWLLEPTPLNQGVSGVHSLGDGRVAVDLENRGGMVMPVTMEVTYDDGSVEIRRLPVEVWTTADRWRAAWNPDERIIMSVTLDPNELYPDTDRQNNTWQVDGYLLEK